MAIVTLSPDISKELCFQLGSINYETFVNLNRQVKKGLAEIQRAEARWERLETKTYLMEDIIENRHSLDHKIRSRFWIERRGDLGNFVDTLG